VRTNQIKKEFVYWLLGSGGLVLIPFIGFDIQAGGFETRGNQLVELNILEGPHLYLAHHALAFLPVFLFGIVLNWFDFRVFFWKDLMVPLILMALFFIAWDILFTSLGVWRFNESYIQGSRFMNLPIEEICWFFIIPFCSLFVYRIVSLKWQSKPGAFLKLQVGLLLGLFVLYILNIDRIYTASSISISMSLLGLSILVKWDRFGQFIASFIVLLIPMGLFNGMLTGLLTKEALVQYNSAEFGGIRMMSFPMEDLGFGFSFLMGILLLSDFIKNWLSANYIHTK